ncbi:MAG: YHS domain protein [Microgenomates group bacterium GW2011_GWC1_41_8]|nr:MAG: YHS domain protein [Microgenomates group bacterium GW2011_GWC1_41_8]
MQQNIKDEQQNKELTEVVTDPVCGMTKPKSEMKEVSVFLGKNYYFCSKEDRELFGAHPDYYVSEEEREKARSI